MPKVLESSIKDLIEIVQEHPSIYDVTDPDHMDRKVSNNICVYRLAVCTGYT